MSRANGLNIAKLTTYFMGAILLTLGLMMAYFSTRADTGIITPRLYTPIALAVAVIGLTMFVVRGE